jgi:molybdate transport system regulatory protein
LILVFLQNAAMTDLIVRIDLGTHGRLGPGKLLLLQHIDEHGSISAAGRAMKMSYRQAWSLVDQLNTAFKEPVVASKPGGRHGGGAHLTDFGKLLLNHCNAIASNAKKSAGPHLDFVNAMLRSSSEADGAAPHAKAKPVKKPLLAPAAASKLRKRQGLA